LSDFHKKVLETLKKHKKPVPLKVLAATVEIDRKILKKVLRELVADGDVLKHGASKFSLADNSNTKIGKIDAHPDGFGFFTPEEGGDDLFVPIKKMNGALHGDKVRIRVEFYRGKPEAAVIEILERGQNEVVGRVERSRRGSYVVPFHRKFFYNVMLSKEDMWAYEEDDIVVVKITEYPGKNTNVFGEVVRTLGKMDDPGMDNKIVMAKYNIDTEFPERVLKEAKKAVQYKKEPGERTDFTQLYTVTIDGETARDFDDAISMEKTEKGYILYVHIADVAHYVRTGSPIDQEAYKRGTSVYFPEFAIHMLPEILSADLCSLRPRTERLAMTAKMWIDKEGNRYKSEFFQSKIKSNKRLTYTYVNEVFERKAESSDGRLKSLLYLSKELAEKMIQRRANQGTLDFDFPEAEFVIDADGMIEDIRPLERNIAHRLIEQFMIEANEAVSEFLEEKASMSVYRVHDKPNLKKIEDFIELASSFGLEMGTDEEMDPKGVRKLCDKLAESDYDHVLGNYLVRAMAKAKYQVQNIGHFGLASMSYTHFTSPIRRYPDLIIHRILKSILFDYEYAMTNEEIVKGAVRSTEREQEAETAEREIHLYKKLKYLEVHKNEPFSAYISKVNKSGMLVFIDKLLMTGSVGVDRMDDDYYVYDEYSKSLVGKKKKNRYRIGDYIEVVMDRVDYDVLEAEFYLGTDVDEQVEEEEPWKKLPPHFFE